MDYWVPPHFSEYLLCSTESETGVNCEIINKTCFFFFFLVHYPFNADYEEKCFNVLDFTFHHKRLEKQRFSSA